MERGIIKTINTAKSGTRYGYIALDGNISDCDKDIIFFEDNLKDTSIDSLAKNMEVEFTIEPYNDRYIARDIVLVSEKSAEAIKPIITLNRRIKAVENSAKPKQVIKPVAKASNKIILDKLNDNLRLIEDISDPNEFEDAVFSLLRLIGIHAVYQYPRKEQAGRADGCFVIENLVVMYDCTLRTSFEEFKEEQIENYVNKLNNKSQLTVKIKKADGGIGSKELQIKNKRGQVWIITKGQTREIKDYDGIRIKEVSIQDLIAIAIKRCKQLSYDLEKLSSDLFFIGM